MFRNTGAKILCLLVALLSWTKVASEADVERSIAVDLEIVALADSLAVAESRLPSSVDVSVRSSRLQLLMADVFGRDFGHVELNLDRAGPGRQRITLSRSDAKVNATPLKILSPQWVDLRVQRRAERAVPVRLRTEGSIPEGYAAVGRPEMTPEIVNVSGPEEIVAGIEAIDTEPVRLDRRRSSFRERVGLVSPDPDVELRPVEVDVTAAIERVVPREFERVLVTVFSDGAESTGRFRLDPTEVRVRVFGAESVVNDLGPEDISVRVPIEPGMRGVDEVEVEVVAIDGVTRTVVEPRTIQVVADAPDTSGTEAEDVDESGRR